MNENYNASSLELFLIGVKESQNIQFSYNVVGPLDINRVIFNDPATIVYWKDGTKTIVKCDNEFFDKEKGLAMAISRKALGNTGNYFEVFKEHCD